MAIGGLLKKSRFEFYFPSLDRVVVSVWAHVQALSRGHFREMDELQPAVRILHQRWAASHKGHEIRYNLSLVLQL